MNKEKKIKELKKIRATLKQRVKEIDADLKKIKKEESRKGE